MPEPTTSAEFLDLVRQSGLADATRLDAFLRKRSPANAAQAPLDVAKLLILEGLLTFFQAEQILQGKYKRFTIGQYRILERLGSGAMGTVYLCEHPETRSRVAIKVLPPVYAKNPEMLKRFYREAKAGGALDHENIVRVYDVDQDEKVHFMVMDYVDGSILLDIVRSHGPMSALRAAHYIRQAASGLQHAHEAGLIHRDVKPGNLLLDRRGTVKILDMGLARFADDEEDVLTKGILGTADYLAPEQTQDSHRVDIRADIYSLGCTFFFLLTGSAPFEGTVAQKLIAHQTKLPKSIRSLRPEVPEGLEAVVTTMMAKDPAQRYQTPAAVAEALGPWTQTPIPLPPEQEMPRICPALLVGAAPSSPVALSASKPVVPELAPVRNAASPFPVQQPTAVTTTPQGMPPPERTASKASPAQPALEPPARPPERPAASRVTRPMGKVVPAAAVIADPAPPPAMDRPRIEPPPPLSDLAARGPAAPIHLASGKGMSPAPARQGTQPPPSQPRKRTGYKWFPISLAILAAVGVVIWWTYFRVPK